MQNQINRSNFERADGSLSFFGSRSRKCEGVFSGGEDGMFTIAYAPNESTTEKRRRKKAVWLKI